MELFRKNRDSPQERLKRIRTEREKAGRVLARYILEHYPASHKYGDYRNIGGDVWLAFDNRHSCHDIDVIVFDGKDSKGDDRWKTVFSARWAYCDPSKKEPEIDKFIPGPWEFHIRMNGEEGARTYVGPDDAQNFGITEEELKSPATANLRRHLDADQEATEKMLREYRNEVLAELNRNN
jgi:hypothetical protein